MQAPHGFYKKLVANGFTAEQAEGLTEAHTEFFSEVLEKETKLIKVDFKSELVTKSDLREELQNLKEEFTEKFASKDDIQNIKNELEKFASKEDLQNVKEELKNDVQDVKKDLHRLELGLVEVQGTLKWFKWLLLSIFAVQVFPLLKTFFENLF